MTLSGRRSRLFAASDAGLSLVEVVIAMFAFAIIALGVAYSLVSTMRSAVDAKNRQVAVNLAAQSIDHARSMSDIFLLSTGVTRTVSKVPGDATAFTLTRSVQWVTSNGIDRSCGAGGGALLQKKINVSVTWPGSSTAFPVRSDTLVAPPSPVNDPALGAILISVHDANGAGVAGVAVTTTPSTGKAIPATDSDGCSYALGVPPASYLVKIARAGYVDVNQVGSPVTANPLVVGAGTTLSADFAYDLAGTVSVSFGAHANLPKDLKTTVSSTITGIDYFTAATAASDRSFALFPATSYTMLAGAFIPAGSSSSGCLNVDPSQWPLGINASGRSIAAPAPTTVSFWPGGGVSTVIPMGVVAYSTTASAVYLSATAATPPPGSGDPGCGTSAPLVSPAVSYNFGPLSAVAGAIVIGLPYGSWTLSTGSNPGSLRPVHDGSRLSAPVGSIGTSVSPGAVVTLDPRVVQP